jgi:hypothetical protein
MSIFSSNIGRVLEVALVGSTLAFAACTDSKPAATDSTSPPSPTSTTTTTTPNTIAKGDAGTGNGSDAGPKGPTGDPTLVCASVAYGARAVQEMADAVTLDEPTGGTIAPGRYVLSQIRGLATVDGGAPTEYEARKAILFTDAGTFAFIQSEGNTTDGVGPSVVTGGTYQTSGVTLTTKDYCPENTGAVVSYPYSAGGNRFALRRGNRWEIYQRK